MELGWRIKTGRERVVPLLPGAVEVVRRVIGARLGGPVFLREKLAGRVPILVGDSRGLERLLRDRRVAGCRALTRTEEAALAKKLWWDAGAVTPDQLRVSFVRARAPSVIRNRPVPRAGGTRSRRSCRMRTLIL